MGEWDDSERRKEIERAAGPQDSWRRYPGKKNKRRWCKGKVGREHDYEEVEKRNGWWERWGGPRRVWITVDRCKVCGKEIHTTYHYANGTKKGPY